MAIQSNQSRKSGVYSLGITTEEDTTNLNKYPNVLILGAFKRGGFKRPFLVTKDNYRAMLGHDPLNHHYMAVEDAFDAGASQLWIVRTNPTI